jgi:hypothetical protein
VYDVNKALLKCKRKKRKEKKRKEKKRKRHSKPWSHKA